MSPTLGWGKSIWTLMAATFLGPLMSFVIYFFVLMVTNPGPIVTIWPLFRLGAFATAFFGLFWLAGGVLLFLYRRFAGTLNGAVATGCGALGAALMVLLFSIFDGEITENRDLVSSTMFGAASGSILWYLRGWMGLRDL